MAAFPLYGGYRLTTDRAFRRFRGVDVALLVGSQDPSPGFGRES